MIINQKTQNSSHTTDFLIRKTSGNGKIVITKKVARKSVDRNRIKRTIKEALRSLDIKQGELQIIVRKNIASAKTHELKEKIEKILKNEN